MRGPAWGGRAAWPCLRPTSPRSPTRDRALHARRSAWRGTCEPTSSTSAGRPATSAREDAGRAPSPRRPAPDGWVGRGRGLGGAGWALLGLPLAACRADPPRAVGVACAGAGGAHPVPFMGPPCTRVTTGSGWALSGCPAHRRTPPTPQIDKSHPVHPRNEDLKKKRTQVACAGPQRSRGGGGVPGRRLPRPPAGPREAGPSAC
jgi:hypothetical protein